MKDWTLYRGRDRIVVVFTTTYAISAISAYHHCCEFESRSGRGVQHYMIKFVSDWRQVGGFLRVLRFVFSTNKTDSHDITEILLKLALNTIKQTNKIQFNLIQWTLILHFNWFIYRGFIGVFIGDLTLACRPLLFFTGCYMVVFIRMLS